MTEIYSMSICRKSAAPNHARACVKTFLGSEDSRVKKFCPEIFLILFLSGPGFLLEGLRGVIAQERVQALRGEKSRASPLTRPRTSF